MVIFFMLHLTYGPMGTGIMVTSNADKLDTIIEGGTGTSSMLLCHPEEMPKKLESGTPNTIGISGLKAGVDFVIKTGIKNIFNHEMELINYAYDGLKNIKNVELYVPRPDRKYFVPVLSFNVKGYISDEIGKILNEKNIAVRTGLHCSPVAHKYFSTIDKGTVRISPSIFTKKIEINKFLKVISSVHNKV